VVHTSPKLFYQYGVCIFRNTGMDDETHVAFSRRFGDLDDLRRFIGKNGTNKLRYNHLELFDAGNIAVDGGLIDPTSARAHYNLVSPKVLPGCP